MTTAAAAPHLRCCMWVSCVVARNSVLFTHHLQPIAVFITESAVFACSMKLARGRVLRLSEAFKPRPLGLLVFSPPFPKFRFSSTATPKIVFFFYS